MQPLITTGSQVEFCNITDFVTRFNCGSCAIFACTSHALPGCKNRCSSLSDCAVYNLWRTVMNNYNQIRTKPSKTALVNMTFSLTYEWRNTGGTRRHLHRACDIMLFNRHYNILWHWAKETHDTNSAHAQHISQLVPFLNSSIPSFRHSDLGRSCIKLLKS